MKLRIWQLAIVAFLSAFSVLATAQSGTWTVKEGDILSRIARRFGVSVTQLRQWNGLSSDRIVEGQRLVIRAKNKKKSTSAVPSVKAPAKKIVPLRTTKQADAPVQKVKKTRLAHSGKTRRLTREERRERRRERFRERRERRRAKRAQRQKDRELRRVAAIAKKRRAKSTHKPKPATKLSAMPTVGTIRAASKAQKSVTPKKRPVPAKRPVVAKKKAKTTPPKLPAAREAKSTRVAKTTARRTRVTSKVAAKKTPVAAAKKKSAKSDPPLRAGLTYKVARGDTPSHIARRFQISVDDLMGMNPGVSPTSLQIGQTLVVGLEDPRKKQSYVLRRGETISRVAQRHLVSVEQIRVWNPGVNLDRIEAGARIVIYSDVPASISESVGKPNHGALLHGEKLGHHPGYLIRDPERAFGTLETVTWISRGFDHVQRLFPNGPRVRVHDISRKHGGRLKGHKSHQSGRDADISFYQGSCPNGVCAMKVVSTKNLDLLRNWAVLSYWLQNGLLEFAFIDYRLQKPLYDLAKKRGATKQQLTKWFQYPRGKHKREGILRHVKGHANHMHVRFKCPDTDAACR